MMKYPIYIVSKGRYENPLTANCFKQDGVEFKIAVEPQEYKAYCDSVGKKYILKLPFSNLGMGSMSARNFCWEDSMKRGAERHWVFDDNIRVFRRLNKGKRIPCNAKTATKIIEDFTDRYINIGISGLNYHWLIVATVKKPFFLNVHVYSAMLIKNDMPYRWRLRYNEDVDLCLQVLNNNLCTILFNAFLVDKVSTTKKMKGGNQTELYKNNRHDRKLLKTRSLEEIWPQYVKTTWKFNRPHHHVAWKKHFKHGLIRNPNYDWDSLKKVDEMGIKLQKKDEIKSESLKTFYQKYKQ